MAPNSGSNNTKRSRSKAPRVRTGCVTCKARHVKCDETKPTCQRCHQDLRRCDGYKITPRLKPGPKPKPNGNAQANLVLLQRLSRGRALLPNPSTQASTRTMGVQQPPSSCVGTIPRSLFEISFTNHLDLSFFVHAQRCFLADVSLESDPTDFWHCYAMPLAHSVAPLKYAICALGAAHRHFLISGSGTLTTNDFILTSEIAAIESYNAAIAKIKVHSRNIASGMDVYVLIMCCMIFVCIENLMGRYADSIRHLQAGSYLLSSNTSSWAASAPPDLRNALFMVFHELYYDSATFNSKEALGDLVCSFTISDMGSRYEPFASYDEASNLLRRLDYIYNASFISAVGASGHQSISDHTCPASGYLALNAAREAFDIWNRRFEALQQSRDEARQHQQPQKKEPVVAKLHLDQSVWALLTAMTTFKDPVAVDSCQSVISNIESFVLMYESQQHPTFVVGGDIVPVLALICVSCRDYDIRLRSVSLLRSLRRREGVWDSGQVADVCEAMIMEQSATDVASYHFPEGLRRWW